MDIEPNAKRKTLLDDDNSSSEDGNMRQVKSARVPYVDPPQDDARFKTPQQNLDEMLEKAKEVPKFAFDVNRAQEIAANYAYAQFKTKLLNAIADGTVIDITPKPDSPAPPSLSSIADPKRRWILEIKTTSAAKSFCESPLWDGDVAWTIANALNSVNYGRIKVRRYASDVLSDLLPSSEHESIRFYFPHIYFSVSHVTGPLRAHTFEKLLEVTKHFLNNPDAGGMEGARFGVVNLMNQEKDISLTAANYCAEYPMISTETLKLKLMELADAAKRLAGQLPDEIPQMPRL